MLNSPTLISSGQAFDQHGLVYRVAQPKSVAQPESVDPHPTVVMIHGRSGSEDVTWVFARTIPQHWLMVAPRAMLTDPRGGYSWDVRLDGGLPPIAAFDRAVAVLDRFINSLVSEHGADAEQIYLLGFSQGAALSYAYTMRYPEKIGGVAGLVGFMPGEVVFSAEYNPLKDKSIFMAVGRRDDTIPLSVAHQCASQIVQGGARLDYREYNTGHKLNMRGIRDLTQWWLQFPNSK